MKKLSVVTFFILMACSLSMAQNIAPAGCPMISVSGPAGIVAVNEIAKYTATVEIDENRKQNLEYIWSTSAGEIVSGQGTASIEVRRPEQSLTTTVEIKGLPSNCPNTASEYSSGGHGSPVAMKIGQFNGADFKSGEIDLDEVVQTMNDNPNNQLFVYFAYEQKPAGEPSLRRERKVIDQLARTIGGRERITSVRVFEGVELIQFWRVPPGANNPTCDECSNAYNGVRPGCPTIMVTGPAGVSLPSDTMIFQATLTGAAPSGVRFHWEVTDGAIMGGQGTRELKARYTNVSGFRATVTVIGLPAECSSSASEVLHMTVDPGPEHLGSINNPMYTINNGLLKRIRESLVSNESSQLYVWVYAGPSAESKFPSLKARLLRQLSGTGIDSSRITLMVSSERARGATFWRVPPGVENPAP